MGDKRQNMDGNAGRHIGALCFATIPYVPSSILALRLTSVSPCLRGSTLSTVTDQTCETAKRLPAAGRE